jgi:hypothetical protein
MSPVPIPKQRFFEDDFIVASCQMLLATSSVALVVMYGTFSVKKFVQLLMLNTEIISTYLLRKDANSRFARSKRTTWSAWASWPYVFT